jgi:nucleoside permease NupC
LIGFVVFLLFEITNVSRVGSLIGLIGYILICIMLSHDPSKIKLETIFGGLILQFGLGMMVLRSEFGYNVFKSIGDTVQNFLALSDAGTTMVFGQNLQEHFLVFKVTQYDI